jgi:hypothetical protein
LENSSGQYFFRARNQDTTVDMTLSGETNVQSVDNDSAGWSRIYNKITVSVGNFSSTISPLTEEESEPHSITKYGLRTFEIDGSSIKIDDDLDLSSGLAAIYYNRYKLPKRELRLLCKMLPQLELSDTVSIDLKTKYPGRWFLGDPTVFLGTKAAFFYSQNIDISMVANVVGLELDLNNFKLYVSVREI